MPTVEQPTAVPAPATDRLEAASLRASQLIPILKLAEGAYSLIGAVMLMDMMTGGKVTYRLTWRLEVLRDQWRRQREARNPTAAGPAEVIQVAERIVNDLLRTGVLRSV